MLGKGRRLRVIFAAESLLMLSNVQTKHDAANQTETPTAVSETTQTMNSSQSVSIQTALSGTEVWSVSVELALAPPLITSLFLQLAILVLV